MHHQGRSSSAARPPQGQVWPSKEDVQQFWDAAACGEIYAAGDSERQRFERQRATRYELEPFIPGFARFDEARGLDVLEIGVGMGADHLEFSKGSPRRLLGLDLTHRAVTLTRQRFKLYAKTTALLVGDAEALALPDDSFDVVYSWGVLHHSPDTGAAVREVRRVLRAGGVARIMVYQRRSLVGMLLWLRYALARGRPRVSLDEIYSRYLESPGTKAYTPGQITSLFQEAGFLTVDTKVELSGGDLLQGAAGQRHEGSILRATRILWPRRLIRRFGRRFGLFLLVEAR